MADEKQYLKSKAGPLLSPVGEAIRAVIQDEAVYARYVSISSPSPGTRVRYDFIVTTLENLSRRRKE